MFENKRKPTRIGNLPFLLGNRIEELVIDELGKIKMFFIHHNIENPPLKEVQLVKTLSFVP